MEEKIPNPLTTPRPTPGVSKVDAQVEARATFRVFRNDGTIETFESDDVRIISTPTPKEDLTNGDGS